MVDRKVKLQKIKGAGLVGGWEIICKECPLLPHLKALSQKPKSCYSGVQDMRGVVPLNACEHVTGKTLNEKTNKLRNDEKLKSLIVPCEFKE